MKKKNNIKRLVFLFCIIISGFLVYSIYGDVKTTFDLNRKIATSDQTIEDLQNQIQDLEKEKENLGNPEYVKRFARGKYMVSKEGEQLFKLPSSEDK